MKKETAGAVSLVGVIGIALLRRDPCRSPRYFSR